MAMKLTRADLATLAHAAFLERRFDAGIFPTGSSKHRHFAKLENLGLLRFDGWGRDIDGEREADVMVYRLTESGRAAAATEASP